jgi:hypothetical protein
LGPILQHPNLQHKNLRQIVQQIADVSALERAFAQTLDQLHDLEAIVEKERRRLGSRRGRRRTHTLDFFIGSLAGLYLQWTECDPRDGISEAHNGRGAIFHGTFYYFVLACVEATGVHRATPTGLARRIQSVLKSDIIFQEELRQFD